MLVVKIGKKTTPRENIEDDVAFLNFVKTKKEIDTLNESLKKSKEHLSTAAKEELGESDAATVTFQKDGYAIKISFGWDIKIKDEDLLKEIIGDRFEDLVETKVTQAPSKKLKELALEDDGLQKCMVVKEKAPSVTMVKVA